jgi:hypothetical protein
MPHKLLHSAPPLSRVAAQKEPIVGEILNSYWLCGPLFHELQEGAQRNPHPLQVVVQLITEFSNAGLQ